MATIHAGPAHSCRTAAPRALLRAPCCSCSQPTTHPGHPCEQATGGKSGKGGGSATSRKNIYKRRRLGSGGSSSLERCYYHFTLGHAAPRTAGCPGVTERPVEHFWSWDLAAAGGDGFLNGLEGGTISSEGGTGQESTRSQLGQHPCTCVGWVPPFFPSSCARCAAPCTLSTGRLPWRSPNPQGFA